MTRGLTALGVVLLIAGIAAVALRDGRRSPGPKREASAAVSVAPVSQPESPPSGAPASPRMAELRLDEASLMAKLRALGETAPTRSIELARVGNARFPQSPDAPERAWIVVKSLVNLQRFHEARDEAKLMVEKYPGTPWALDAERHLLVYPLDQPSREEQQQQAPEGQQP